MELTREWAWIAIFPGMVCLLLIKKYLRKLKNCFGRKKCSNQYEKVADPKQIRRKVKDNKKTFEIRSEEILTTENELSTSNGNSSIEQSSIINDSEKTTSEFIENNLTSEERRKISKMVSSNEFRPLARALQITEQKIEEIEIKCNTAHLGFEEVIIQILQEWKKQNGKTATRQVLIKALYSVGRKDIVNEVFSNMPENNEDDKMKYKVTEEKIEEMQREKCTDIQLPQLSWTEKILPLDELYIDLELLNTVNHYEENERKEIKLEQLFNNIQGKEPVRILIEGGPGYGKTTLCLKLLSDWGLKKDYISDKFKMVFLFEMRYVEENDSLEELFKRDFEAIDVQGEEGISCVKSFANETLVILDGFDEMNEDCQRKFLPLLQKIKYPSMYVIVTSRRGMFNSGKRKEAHHGGFYDKNSENINSNDFFRKRILIKGVTTDKTEKFLKNYLNEDYEELKSKINSITKGDIKEVFNCPLILILLAIMLGERNLDAINSNTKLYQEFFTFIIRRNLIREKKISEEEEIEIFNWSAERPDLINSLDDFGKLSLEFLCKNKLLFEEKEALKFCKDKMIQGFLTKIPKIKRREKENFYQPIHKSFLEFLAAFAMWMLFKRDENQFKREIAEIGKKGLKPTNDSLFYVFLGGLMSDKAYVLFESLNHYRSWFNIESICFTKILMEIEGVNCSDVNSFYSSFEQVLDLFVPSYYAIDDFKGLTDDYFQSQIHSFILKRACSYHRRLIKVLWWDSDYSINLSHELYVDCLKLYLTRGVFTTNSNKNVHAITCTNVICHVSQHFDIKNWDVFVSFFKSIKFESVNFLLNAASRKINSFVLDLLHKELIGGHWKQMIIERLRLELNERDDPESISLLVDLVKKKRIKEGVYVWIKDSQKRTEDDFKILKKETEELFNAVIESETMKEFVVYNYDFKFCPHFNFSRVHKLRLKLFNFMGSVTFSNSKENKTEKCIFEEVTVLSSNVSNNVIFVGNMDEAKYLYCKLNSFNKIVENKWVGLKKIEEIELFIPDNEEMNVLSSVPELTNLQVVSLNVMKINTVPSNSEETFIHLFSSLNLTICEFLYVQNFELFSFFVETLMKGLNKKEEEGKKFQLIELVFYFDQREVNLNELLKCNTIKYIHSMLRKKQLQRLCWVNYNNNVKALELESLFPSDNGFRISYEVNGMNSKSSRQSQFNFRWFSVFDKFCIEYFEEPPAKQSLGTTWNI